MEDFENCRFCAEITLDIPKSHELVQAFQHTQPLTSAARILIIWVCLQALLLMLFMPWDGGAYIGMAFLICVIHLISRLISNRKNRNGNLYYKRAVLGNGGKVVRNKLFFGSQSLLVCNMDNENRLTYDYNRIRSLTETQNLLIVEFDYRMCLFVEKNRITGGSFQEFSSFLLKNSVNLKKKRIRRPRFGEWCDRILLGSTVFTAVMAVVYFVVMQILSF